MNSQVLDRMVRWFLVIIITLGIGYVGMYLLQKYVLFPAFMKANVVGIAFTGGPSLPGRPSNEATVSEPILWKSELRQENTEVYITDPVSAASFSALIVPPTWMKPIPYVEISRSGEPMKQHWLGFWTVGRTIYADDWVILTVRDDAATGR